MAFAIVDVAKQLSNDTFVGKMKPGVVSKLTSTLPEVQLGDTEFFDLSARTKGEIVGEAEAKNPTPTNAPLRHIRTVKIQYTERMSEEFLIYDKAKHLHIVENLAKKYDTFMTDRHFTTTDGRNITISQGRYSTGQYGWWMDQEKTVEKLLEYIENGQSVTVDPIYVQLDTGYTYEGFEHGRSKDGDIGDTYIEIDLSAQHLWYYQDGELKFETLNIVSGKATDPNRKTPGGIYSVYTKSTNYTMVAPDNSYRAKCSYFMRLSFEGIGLHDLSRGQYGGNTYINNGSHGCINMKYSEVQTLYNMVERGTPAILYY